jgi:predicted NUDIX family NTP pyrophosphohydrolase
MPRRSAGLLCYRRTGSGIEVLLVHPGGPFWAAKDDGAWSIPKGEIAPDEDPLRAAQREFAEELNATADGPFVPLEAVRQAGGKVVIAWACEADVDVSAFTSNTFSMEWPPRSGTMREFPEVDRAEWFPLATARQKILKGQTPLLDQVEAMIRTRPDRRTSRIDPETELG